MVKRTVQFTAKTDGGVTPAIPLFGGVKGEHNATVLEVTLESDVYEDGDLVRLSFTTGDGTVLSSDLIEDITIAEDGTATVTYALPQLLTIAAGQLCVRVVVSEINDESKETECWRSGEMVLYFEHADVENGTPFWTGVSEMLSRTVAAKNVAVVAASKAELYHSKTYEYEKSAVEAKTSAEEAAKKACDAETAISELAGDISDYYVATNAAKKAAVDAQAGAEAAAASAWEAVETLEKGDNGITPHIGDNGNWYIGDTDTGVKAQGDKGDAYTLTDIDKAAIVADVSAVAVAKNQGAANVGKILVVGTDGNLVLTDMPEGGTSGDVIGTLDDNNNILLSGNLADGTYTLKYENEYGTYTEVGTLEVGAIPEPEVVVNLVPTLLDPNLTDVYNGVGYQAGMRVSNSANGESETVADTVLTGLIPLGNDGDEFHIRGVTSVSIVDGQYSGIRSCWDASGNYIASSVADIPTSCIGTDANGDFLITMTHSAWNLPEDTAYIRLQFYKVTGDFIITRNQLITV